MSRSSAASLRLDDVTKVFGGHTAVDKVNLQASGGDFLVLLGPSGCGKSTLLRMICGLETPTGGKVLVDGEDVALVPPSKRRMAFVFQSYALYPHMTVKENVTFPLVMERHRWYWHAPLVGMAMRARARRDAGVRARVDTTLRTLGIDEFAARFPRTLSGGQRQRVALARSLAREPNLFLMDEPLSNLDAKLRTEMRAELVKFHRSVHRTTIYVTHDQVEAMTMGTKIAVMSQGRVRQVGSPSEIYRAPADTFVAGFIGHPPMNLIPGRLSPSGQVKLLDGSTLDLQTHPAALGGERDVYVGVRPEDLMVIPGDSSAAHTVTGVVTVVEDLGSELLVRVELAAGDTDKHEITVKHKPDGRVQYGDHVRIAVDVASISLFDYGTGVRIGPT